MIEDYESQRRKQVSGFRSVIDYAMGVLFIIIGGYFLLSNPMGFSFMGREPATIDYFIGLLFLAYGGWRIYRGYKKNYFN